MKEATATIRELPYERIDSKAMFSAISLRADEHLLVLQPFGWHLDGKHIPNMAEHFCREWVVRELGYEVAFDFGVYVAVVRPRDNGGVQEAPSSDRGL